MGLPTSKGNPHFYERIFDFAGDDYSDMYRLTPVDDRSFRLAMDAWEIWCRWELAFHTGKAKMESHPALPEDIARHKELKLVLDKALQSSPNAIIQTGTFSVLGQSDQPPGVLRNQQVRWINP
jgi:hypothetical protein